MPVPHRVAIWFLAALLALVSAARADSVNYGSFTGTDPGDVSFLQVIESTMTDSAPLYGPPVRVGNSLFFFPARFHSSASNGGADTTSGTLTMRLQADTGFFLEMITIVERGSYQFTGTGSSATQATINGLLTLTDIMPGTHATLRSTLSVTPSPIYSLPGELAGDFTAITRIDLTGLGISKVVFNLNNNLQTTSEQGTTAFIEKRTVEIHTPEPAALGILLIGAFALRRRVC